MSQRHAQQGSVTVLAVVLALALMAVIGLAVDGGRLLSARQAAAADAEQAARAGASQLVMSSLRGGEVVVDPLAARAAADQYLASVGQSATVLVSSTAVTVTITGSVRTVLLGLIGISSFAYQVSETAINVHGVVEEDP